MTNERWNAMLELAKDSTAIKANDGCDYLLTYDDDRRCIWLYINGDVRELYRSHSDIQYDYIMVFRDMWNEWVKSKSDTHND